jgi:hypothetical protein
MLSLMYIHPMFLEVAFRKLTGTFPVMERFGEAVVLPYATWAVLGVIASLAIVGRISGCAPSESTQA